MAVIAAKVWRVDHSPSHPVWLSMFHKRSGAPMKKFLSLTALGLALSISAVHAADAPAAAAAPAAKVAPATAAAPAAATPAAPASAPAAAPTKQQTKMATCNFMPTASRRLTRLRWRRPMATVSRATTRSSMATSAPVLWLPNFFYALMGRCWGPTMRRVCSQCSPLPPATCRKKALRRGCVCTALHGHEKVLIDSKPFMVLALV